MAELSKIVNMSQPAIRKWEKRKDFPSKLLPARDANNFRFWTPKKAEGILKWLEERDESKNRSKEERQLHIDKLRKPHQLNSLHIEFIRERAKDGWTVYQVCELLDTLRITKYKSRASLIEAVEKACVFYKIELAKDLHGNDKEYSNTVKIFRKNAAES